MRLLEQNAVGADGLVPVVLDDVGFLQQPREEHGKQCGVGDVDDVGGTDESR